MTNHQDDIDPNSYRLTLLHNERSEVYLGTHKKVQGLIYISTSLDFITIKILMK
jgi:hypothetical protein